MSVPFLALAYRAARVSVFRSEVTPEPGEPLIWVTPTTKVEDPLFAKGVIIEDRGTRYVLCAFDWCGLGGSTHLHFRDAIAEAAGSDPDHVWLHTIHQHTAPYIDGDAYAILRGVPDPPLMMSNGFIGRITERLAGAVRKAAANMRPFDSLGMGQAKVEKVASARRLLDGNGKAITRYSTSGADPKMAAAPEGDIDPAIRTVTLAAGGKPQVRIHFYATHPQTYCCDGRVSGDIVNTAREALEREEGVAQIYFTGCAGDVTVGKYNDKTSEAQDGLAQRLKQGMRASIRSTRFEAAGPVSFRMTDFRLTPKTVPRAKSVTALEELVRSRTRDGQERYKDAIMLAFNRRRRPLRAALIETGKLSILHLPGEPMVEFQRYAQSRRPNGFVTVAGYGDISPGYLCTDRAMEEGGYEPGAANSGPGTETAVKKVIQELFEGSTRRLPDYAR
jgi:hypothetical protein